MHEGHVYVYEPRRARRSSGSSATYYSVVRANTRRFEEFDDNDVTGTVVRRDGHGRGRGREQGEHVRVVASGDRRVRERQDVGQRIQREYSARNKNVDTDDSCYSIFGSYLTDEKMNVKNVHFSETNSQVGNTVVCLDMSGSQSSSLSGKVVTVADILTKPLRYERYGRSTKETMPDKEKKAERSRRKAGRRPAASRCEPRSSRRPSRREYGVEVERQTAVCAQGNATQQRKGTQPNKARERNPTAKRGNETQEQSKGTKPKNKTRERDPKTEGAPTRRTEGAPTQRPETATTSQGPSEETAGRRSPSSGPTLEKWGDVWTSRPNCG